VTASLAGDRPVEVVWVQRGRRDRRVREVEDLARERGVPLKLVGRERLDALAEGAPHNGCAARTAPVALHALEELIRDSDEPGRLLLVDDVIDPHNVGALIRTAAAFGIDGVILAGPSAPPLGGALARAAAGQLERLPIVRATVAGDALARLRDHGYWAFGAQAGAAPAAGVSTTRRWVLCMGSEERGLRAKTRAGIDEWIAIPMAAGVESLNVSVAAGVLLYELCGRGR
jgi:23S rRNA (guanosine2251-2'-O)-methyltransferase